MRRICEKAGEDVILMDGFFMARSIGGMNGFGRGCKRRNYIAKRHGHAYICSFSFVMESLLLLGVNDNRRNDQSGNLQDIRFK